MSKLKDNWPLALALSALMAVVGYVAQQSSSTLDRLTEQVSAVVGGLGIVNEKVFTLGDDVEDNEDDIRENRDDIRNLERDGR